MRPHTSSVYQTNACHSQWSCAMKPVNVLVITPIFPKLIKDYFTEGFSWCMWGIESKQHMAVSKANSASSHIWLKTSPELILKFSELIQNRLREMNRYIVMYFSNSNVHLISNTWPFLHDRNAATIVNHWIWTSKLPFTKFSITFSRFLK